MGLMDIIRGLLMEIKKLEINKLPSQGIFYNDDFNISIKKADMQDIIEYEHRFDKDNLMIVIDCIKRIVSKNVILDNYSYLDIKSVDIIFIFLEIVKFTTKKEIKIPFISKSGEEEFIEFNSKNFNYFNFDKYMKYYNKDSKDILINGYKFSPPSIGVESSLTQYLSTKINDPDIERLNEASYDFMFFLGFKNSLTADEIENLIQIFNYDIDDSEIKKIKEIVNKFKNMTGYSLVINGMPVEIKTKINLQDIWKSNIQ